jgi:exosortase A
VTTDAIAAADTVGRSATRTEIWKVHLAVLGALLVLLAGLFFADVKAAAEVWWYYPAYSHCFLIIPIAAWLIWERRATLISDTPAAMPWVLVGALPCLLLWLAGAFGSVTEFRQFAIIGLAEIFCVAVLGWHIFRKISFACLYLFFLVPTGQYLIPPLQQVTAKFVEVGLGMLSIPFFREGLVFDLVNGHYEIAEACAGLRFLIATIALGVLFAHMMYRKPWKIAVFLLACLIVPVIGNGLRALFTVAVANYTDNRVAAGIDHILYGWAFAVAILFAVMYVGARFKDAEADRPPPSGLDRPARYPLLVISALFALAIVSVGPATAYYADRPSGAGQAALDDLVTPPGWQGRSADGDWESVFDPAAARTLAAVQPKKGGFAAPVDIDIHYYIRKRGAPSLMSERNHAWDVETWHIIARRSTTARLDGAPRPLEEALIASRDLKRLVWTTYWVDGHFSIAPLTVRMLEFRGALTHGHSAAIVLSTPVTSSENDARSRLAALLGAFPNLSESLRKVGDVPAETR